jgi:hypothetical protein
MFFSDYSVAKGGLEQGGGRLVRLVAITDAMITPAASGSGQKATLTDQLEG